MIRMTLTAAVLALTAGAAFAQTAPAPRDPQSADMQAYLRAKGEAYSRAPDSEQNPAEVEATARLNAEVAARNDAAERSESEGAMASADAQAKYQAQTSGYASAQAQYEADARAAEAARAEYDRARATWEGLIRACEESGRRDCRAAQSPGY